MKDPNINNSVVSEDKTPWYFRRSPVIWLILMFGPLVLPLLWLSPKFKSGTKICVTILLVLLTYATFRLTPMLMTYLEKGLSGALV